MRMFLTLLFIIVLPSFSQSLEPKVKTATRTLQRSDGFFVIEYSYGPGFSVPLTNPPGQPHYFAKITVSMVVNGKLLQVGQPFDGEYTLNGCFEDEPKSLVDYALKHKDDPKPSGNRGVIVGSSGRVPMTHMGEKQEFSCLPSPMQVQEAVKKLKDSAERFEERFGNKSSANEEPMTQGATVFVISGTIQMFADTLNDLFMCVSGKK